MMMKTKREGCLMQLMRLLTGTHRNLYKLVRFRDLKIGYEIDLRVIGGQDFGMVTEKPWSGIVVLQRGPLKVLSCFWAPPYTYVPVLKSTMTENP